MNHLEIEEIIHGLTNIRLSEIEDDKDKIKEKVKILIDNEIVIEDEILKSAENLNISSEALAEVIDHLIVTIDDLAIRYCPEVLRYARKDRPAEQNKTAAGVFTYAEKNGEVYALLAKRDDNEQWECFGGKSDDIDEFMHTTAAREVYEESNQQFVYTTASLLDAPFHDFVTEKNNSPFIFRLYFKKYSYVEESQFNDNEHTEYRWVTIKELLEGLEKKAEAAENTNTTIQSGGKSLPLDIEFYQVIQQPRVKECLERLKKNKPLKNMHTQGSKSVTNTDISRRVQSQKEKTWQAKRAVAKHLAVMKEIKEQNKRIPEEKVIDQTFESQSELHMRAILGNRYKKNDLRANVAAMVNIIAKQVEKKLENNEEKEKLIDSCERLIAEEKKLGSDYLFFYHACPEKTAFAYAVYSAIHAHMQINPTWSAYRVANDYFKDFKNVEQFIDHYSKNRKDMINNNSPGYSEVAISTNGALFGNHLIMGSCSLVYFLENTSARNINLEELLKTVLADAGFPAVYVKPLTDLYESHFKRSRGVLYQIGIPTTLADQLAYAASVGGPLNYYEGSYQPSEVFAKLKKDLDSQDQNRIKVATDYLVTTQMRLMVPPHHSLFINTITEDDLKPDSAQSKKKIENNENIILDLVDEMLRNASKETFHPNTPVVTLTTLHLEKNKLPAGKKVSQAGLRRAIEGRQYDLVKRYLEENSNLRVYAAGISIVNEDYKLAKILTDIDSTIKNKEILLPKNYLDSGSSQVQEQKAPVLNWILQKILYPEEMLIAFFGDNWVDLINESHQPYLDRVLGALPEEKQLSFAKMNIPKNDDGIDILKASLQHFSELDKKQIMLYFLEFFVEDEKKLDSYIDKISKPDSLFAKQDKAYEEIITYLFDKKLDVFVSPKSFAQLIRRGKEEKDYLVTAKKYFASNQDLFKQMPNLKAMVEILPDNDQKVFISDILNHQKVSDDVKACARLWLANNDIFFSMAQQVLDEESFKELTKNILTLNRKELIEGYIDRKNNFTNDFIAKVILEAIPKEDRERFCRKVLKCKTLTQDAKKAAADWLKHQCNDNKIALVQAIQEKNVGSIVNYIKRVDFIHDEFPADYFAAEQELVSIFELIMSQKYGMDSKKAVLEACYGNDWQKVIPTSQIQRQAKRMVEQIQHKAINAELVASMKSYFDFLRLLNEENLKLICNQCPEIFTIYLNYLLPSDLSDCDHSERPYVFHGGFSDPQGDIILSAITSAIEAVVIQRVTSQDEFIKLYSFVINNISSGGIEIRDELLLQISRVAVNKTNIFSSADDCINVMTTMAKSIYLNLSSVFAACKEILLDKINSVEQINKLLDNSLHLSDSDRSVIIDSLTKHRKKILNDVDKSICIYSNNYRYRNEIYNALKAHFSEQADNLEKFITISGKLKAEHQSDFVKNNWNKYMLIQDYTLAQLVALIKLLSNEQCQDFINELNLKEKKITQSYEEAYSLSSLTEEKKSIVYKAVKKNLGECVKNYLYKLSYLLSIFGENDAVDFMKSNVQVLIEKIKGENDYKNFKNELKSDDLKTEMQGILVDYANDFLDKYQELYPDLKPQRGLRLFDKKGAETFLSMLQNAGDSLTRYFLIQSTLKMGDTRATKVHEEIMGIKTSQNKPII